jgi:hypothetical protein
VNGEWVVRIGRSVWRAEAVFDVKTLFGDLTKCRSDSEYADRAATLVQQGVAFAYTDNFSAKLREAIVGCESEASIHAFMDSFEVLSETYSQKATIQWLVAFLQTEEHAGRVKFGAIEHRGNRVMLQLFDLFLLGQEIGASKLHAIVAVAPKRAQTKAPVGAWANQVLKENTGAKPLATSNPGSARKRKALPPTSSSVGRCYDDRDGKVCTKTACKFRHESQPAK